MPIQTLIESLETTQLAFIRTDSEFLRMLATIIESAMNALDCGNIALAEDIVSQLAKIGGDTTMTHLYPVSAQLRDMLNI